MANRLWFGGLPPGCDFAVGLAPRAGPENGLPPPATGGFAHTPNRTGPLLDVLVSFHSASLPTFPGRLAPPESGSQTGTCSRQHGTNARMAHDGSDGAYVRRVLDGERRAFQVLIERYEGMVFDLTHRYATSAEDAEDLVQDVFLKAYDRLSDIRDPDRFASWLYGVALNHCRDYAKNVRRKTYAFSRTDEREDRISAQPEARQDAQLEADEDSQHLWEALDTLSPTYSVPFLLKYRDGMTYKAMSKRMDVSVSALKVRVHRARKKLRRIIQQKRDDHA